MARNADYHQYQPFYSVVDTGSEYSIEKIAVNEKHLRLLVEEIKTILSPKIVALFGEKNEVQSAVQKLLQKPDWQFPIEDCHSESTILYVIIKEQLVVVFFATSESFLMQKSIDGESIVVTLYRYLQDISPTILHCPSKQIIENFHPGAKNPFSAQANTKTVFHLEEQVNKKIVCDTINTNTNILQRECGTDFSALVLNDNNSNYFLHTKLETYERNDIDRMQESAKELQRLLMLMTFEHKPSNIEETVRNLSFSVTGPLLTEIVTWHKQYTDDLLKCRNNVHSNLKSFTNDIFDYLIGKKKTKYLFLSGDSKYAFTDRASRSQLDDLVSFLINVISEGCVRCVLVLENTYRDELYSIFINRVTDTIFQWLDYSRVAKRKDALKSDIERYAKWEFEGQLARDKWRSIVRSSNANLEQLLKTYINSIKNASVMRLSPCCINAVQDNQGAYVNLSFSPVGNATEVDSTFLLKCFKNLNEPDSEEIVRNTRIRAAIPMNNGRAFLVLFSYLGQFYRRSLCLAVISNGPIRKISTFYMDDCLLLVEDAGNDVQTVTLITIKLDGELLEVLIHEVNESWIVKDKSRFQVESSISGRVVSAAIFGKRKSLLVLTDQGNVYEISTETKEAREIHFQENTDSGIVKNKILPQKGKQYKGVRSMKVDNLFILWNEHVIDIYDWNICMVKSFDVQDCIAVKVFSDSVNIYLAAISKQQAVGFIFHGLSTEIVLNKKSEEKLELKGNPIIDVIYASYLKYGPASSYAGCPEQNKYRMLVVSDESFENKLKTYLKTFAIVLSLDCLKLDQAALCATEFDRKLLIQVLLSRVPVHVCTIEENNLMPLIDGKRHKLLRNQSSIAEMASFITFSHLESVFAGLPRDKSIRVVSIIGRQSSGKSYLLNRIFGTRFSVAATRCTDGIWLSYAHLINKDTGNEQEFMVLDCEGLFSINRNEQEEVKLLTVLAAVSDVTILNQDLNFNRHLNHLFMNLNNAVDRVKGSKYFEGLLMTTIRDVSSIEGAKAAKEFERNVTILNQRGEHKFLKRLFKGTIILQCMNNYTNLLFSDEVNEIRSTLFSYDFEAQGISKRHWPDGPSLVENLKVVLLQLYSDDEQSADEHVKQFRLVQLEMEIAAAWGDISKIGNSAKEVVSFDYLDKYDDVYNRLKETNAAAHNVISVSQTDVTFDFDPENVDLGFNRILEKLSDTFFVGYQEQKWQKTIINRHRQAFNDFLCAFVCSRTQCLENYANAEVEKLDNILRPDEKKTFLLTVQGKIRSLSANCCLCLEKCSKCHLKCVERKGHKDNILQTKSEITKKIEVLKTVTSREQRENIDRLKKQLEEFNQTKSTLQNDLTSTEDDKKMAEKCELLSTSLQAVSLELKEKEDLVSKRVLDTSVDTIKPLDVIVHNASKWQIDSAQALTSALSSFCNAKATSTIADSERLVEPKLDAELQRCFDAISNSLVAIIPETSELEEQSLAIANIITDVQHELSRISGDLEMLSSRKRNETKAVEMEESTTDSQEDQENKKNNTSEKNCDKHTEDDVEHVGLLRNSFQLYDVSKAVCILQAPNKVLQLCLEKSRKSEESSKSLKNSLATAKTELDSLLASKDKSTSEQELMASVLNSVNVVVEEQLKLCQGVRDQLKQLREKKQIIYSTKGTTDDITAHISSLETQKSGINGELKSLCEQWPLQQISKEEGLRRTAHILECAKTQLSTAHNTAQQQLQNTNTGDEPNSAEVDELNYNSDDASDSSSIEVINRSSFLSVDNDNVDGSLREREGTLEKDDCETPKMSSCTSDLSEIVSQQIEQPANETSNLIVDFDRSQNLPTIEAVSVNQQTENYDNVLTSTTSTVPFSSQQSCISECTSDCNVPSEQRNLEVAMTLAKEIAELSHRKTSLTETLQGFETIKREVTAMELAVQQQSKEKLNADIENFSQSLLQLREEQKALCKEEDKKKNIVAKSKAKLEACQDPEWCDSDGEHASELVIRAIEEKLANAEKSVSKINENMAHNDVAIQDLETKKKETEWKLQTVLNFPDAYCKKLRKLKARKKIHQENEMKLPTMHTNVNDLKDEIKSKTKKLKAMFWNDTVAVRKSALQSQFSQIDQFINDSKSTLTNLSAIEAEEARLDSFERTLQSSIEILKEEQHSLETKCKKNQSVIDELQGQTTGISTIIDNYKRDYDNTLLELNCFGKISVEFSAAGSLINQLEERMALDEGHIKGFLHDVNALMKHLQTQIEIQQIQKDTETLSLQKEQLTEQHQTALAQRSSLTIEELNVQLENLRTQIADVTEKIRQKSHVLHASNEFTELSDKLARLESTAECLCPTDHTCDEVCYICPDDKPCKHSAGHDGDHICDKDQHDCLEMCEICKEKMCMYAVKHTNPASHKCSSTHQCKVKCKFCPKICVKLITEPHTEHRCSETRCPKKCIMTKCVDLCAGPHDHDHHAEFIANPTNASEDIKLHLCEKEHNCNEDCNYEGVCQIQYISETKVWEDSISSQEYEYIKPLKSSKQCTVTIPAGSYQHEGDHNCGNQHTCEEKCPECGSFCKEVLGHDGRHKTVTHRNKEFCYCVSRSSEGTRVEGEGSGKKARVYKPGDTFMLETCGQQCARKGRAHYHLIPCPGGKSCAALKYPGMVEHCTEERFYPNLEIIYDKYLCEKFWAHHGWHMACEDARIRQCNYYCPHSSHPGTEPSFCERVAWHSKSDNPKEHHFPCHDFETIVFHGLQLCFCIDTTSSMKEYIDQSKFAITQIINDAIKSLATFNKDASCLKFAIVSYQDHDFTPLIVQCQPFTTAEDAINYLGKLEAREGSKDPPEAVMDGLNAVANLPWEKDKLKIVFHILDYPPHGKKFYSGRDSYPDGCPCGLEEGPILQKMKTSDISYHVIPLTHHLNQMITEFEKHIKVTRHELEDTVDLPSMISRSVCKAIEDSEFIATR